MMHAQTRTFLLAGFVLGAFLGCDAGTPESVTPGDAVLSEDQVSFRSGPLDWCDVFRCEPCPSTGCPPGGEAVSYCCPVGAPCTSIHEVPDGTTCPTGSYKVICQWGMTNVDGSFTCYDDA